MRIGGTNVTRHSQRWYRRNDSLVYINVFKIDMYYLFNFSIFRHHKSDINLHHFFVTHCILPMSMQIILFFNFHDICCDFVINNTFFGGISSEEEDIILTLLDIIAKFWNALFLRLLCTIPAFSPISSCQAGCKKRDQVSHLEKTPAELKSLCQALHHSGRQPTCPRPTPSPCQPNLSQVALSSHHLSITIQRPAFQFCWVKSQDQETHFAALVIHFCLPK